MRIAGKIVLPVAVGVAMSVIGGCGQPFGRVDVREGGVPQGVALPGPSAVVAGFSPAQISVHPLSRLEGVGDARRAVVHIQVVDTYGQDIKWPGAVGVETAPSDSFTDARSHWVDLTAGESNARVFDSISRCYAVRVPAPGTGRVYVKVRWMMSEADGKAVELQAQGVLQEPK